MFKSVKGNVSRTWSFLKKMFWIFGLWGFVYSVISIGKLKVAFDYDDTLVFSSPAFAKAYESGAEPFSPRFWNVVNNSYDLEKPKIVSNSLAWILRLLGFQITIISSRSGEGGEALKKEWRRLASQFIFAQDRYKKHIYLNQQDGCLLFFGDADTDITEGRLAKVYTFRILRSPNSTYKEDYHPGTLQEISIPFSQY